MHEPARRIDLEELALDGVRAPVADARSAPAATQAHLARPLPRVEDAGSDPPCADLVRDQRPENPLRGSRDLDAGEDETLGEVGDGKRSAVFDAAHVPPT